MAAPRDPFAAGWSLVGADGPPLCPGSGQLVAFTVLGGWTCDVCGRMVKATGSPAALADHHRPDAEPGPPTLGL